MRVTIHPSALKGSIRVPASKSCMQRACAAAWIRKGTTVLHNPGRSEDDKAALDIIQKLGAVVVQQGDELLISSPGFTSRNENVLPEDAELNCGESGLGLRMFVPLVALSGESIRVNGRGSLLNRPMDFFEEVLPALGVTVRSKKGKLPLLIKGPLQPKDISIEGSLSSQFVTGLLMAYSAAGANHVSIKVNNLQSKPYIDLTLAVMKAFGMVVPENRNYEEFHFADPTTSESRPPVLDYTIEGDWSGGAFLLVAGAIAGPITVRGLDLASTQADRAILDALMAANAGIAMEAKGIKIHPARMNGFTFDATNCPDLFPPLAALAAYCEGDTSIWGVNRLIYKESNRALALWEEFGKMGIAVDVKDDIMTIHGGQPVKGAVVHSHFDHRIAMACTIAALKAEGDTFVEKAGAVKKSYPDFYRDLKSLGADVSLPNQLLNL